MNKRSSAQREKEKEIDSTSTMSRNQKLITLALVLSILASLGAAFYFYNQWRGLKDDPQKVAQEEAKALVIKVGKLIVLPEGEEPTIATVTDPELLRDQPFFANAKKGDKVLIYANTGKAILYDPAEDKIIEVAPVSIGPTQPQPQPQPQPEVQPNQ